MQCLQRVCIAVVVIDHCMHGRPMMVANHYCRMYMKTAQKILILIFWSIRVNLFLCQCCGLLGLPDEQEEAYKSFPGVLLAVRYIKEVVSNLFNQ